MIQSLKKNWLVVWTMTWEIWKIFTRGLESIKIGTLMGSFSKVENPWAKIFYRGVMKMIKNLKMNSLVISKLTWGMWQTLSRTLKSLKNVHFNWLLLSKIYIVWAKKVLRSYLSWHWGLMLNLKKHWLVVWKMKEGIWQIFTRALKSLKIGTLNV